MTNNPPQKMQPAKGVQQTVASGAESQRIVLVGTYKKEPDQLKWIGQRHLYNYPLSEEEAKQPTDGWTKVKELWLYSGTKDKRHIYEAEFVGVKPRKEFLAEHPDYPKGKTKHGDFYAVFKVRHKYQPTLDESVVVVRAADFKRTPEIAQAVRAYQAGGELGCLLNYLPAELAPIKHEQLFVCEEALQLDFYDYFIKPYTVKQPIKHAFVDLFAGCGGLSLGLEEAGFTPVLVNELNPDAMATYLANRVADFPWLQKNNVNNVKDLVLKPDLLQSFIDRIRDELGVDAEKGELDLVCGGPPCQGFSGIGYRRSYSVTKDQLPSNYLYQDMAFLVNRLSPKIFLFENVRGLLTSKWNDEGKNGEIFEDVLKTFKAIGKYHVCFKLVHAKDYGVPQNRPRILIVGLRKDVFPEMDKDGQDAVEAGFLPTPSGGAPDLIDLLGDLIDPRQENGGKTFVYKSDPQTDAQRALRTRRDGSVMAKGDTLEEQEYSKHADVIIAKFKAMHQNGGIIPEEFRTKKFSQRLLPEHWGKEGPTITACSAPDDYVHFAQPRGLTVREWARLQMFPDWYEFCGKRTTGGLRRAGNPREGLFDRELPKYTQIGNAVPVGLARKVGEHFIHLLEEKDNKTC